MMSWKQPNHGRCCCHSAQGLRFTCNSATGPLRCSAGGCFALCKVAPWPSAAWNECSPGDVLLRDCGCHHSGLVRHIPPRPALHWPLKNKQPRVQTPLQSRRCCPAVPLCGTMEIPDGRLPLVSFSGADPSTKKYGKLQNCGPPVYEWSYVWESAAAESRSVFPAHGGSSLALSPLRAAFDAPASLGFQRFRLCTLKG